MNKKMIGIFACMLLIATVLPAATVNSSDFDISDSSDSHVIEGVPLITEGAPSRCPWLTATAIIQYYGINATLNEVFHHSGGGYSFGYK